jgi:hypothetical protein
LALVGAEHMIFTGGCDPPRTVLGLIPMDLCSDPAWDRNEAHGVVAKYITAFLLAELAGEPDAADALSPAAPGLGNVDYGVRCY